MGAQAITGTFQSVAVAIAEAEANIQPIHQRHHEKAAKLWIRIQTLEDTHPLSKASVRVFRRYISPLQKIAQMHQQPEDELETIQAYAVPPWQKRIDLVKMDYQEAAQRARDAQGIVIATSSSEKNGIVGMGGAICDTTTTGSSETAPTADYSVTLGPRNKTNPYIAELVAIATALKNLTELPVKNKVITILSNNLSALQALNRLRQQSGQGNIY